MQIDTTARNAELDQIETSIGTSPYLQFWSGTPPTDCNVTMANWATSTVYSLNTYVQANGAYYKCTTAGTSASSGSGPSGTGGSIADNTAVWAYQGSKLSEGQLPSDWLANALSGSKAKSGTWTTTGLVGGFYAQWFAIWDSGKTRRAIQGLVGQAWAASTPYVVGQQVINGGNVYKCTTGGTSASSGGPTGTGGSISDGAVTWAYVGASDMTVDNVSVNAGQVTTVNSFTLTAGNA